MFMHFRFYRFFLLMLCAPLCATNTHVVPLIESTSLTPKTTRFKGINLHVPIFTYKENGTVFAKKKEVFQQQFTSFFKSLSSEAVGSTLLDILLFLLLCLGGYLGYSFGFFSTLLQLLMIAGMLWVARSYINPMRDGISNLFPLLSPVATLLSLLPLILGIYITVRYCNKIISLLCANILLVYIDRIIGCIVGFGLISWFIAEGIDLKPFSEHSILYPLLQDVQEELMWLSQLIKKLSL